MLLSQRQSRGLGWVELAQQENTWTVKWLLLRLQLLISFPRGQVKQQGGWIELAQQQEGDGCVIVYELPAQYLALAV